MPDSRLLVPAFEPIIGPTAPGWAYINQAITANNLYGYKVRFPRRVRLTGFSFVVGAAVTAGDGIEIGIVTPDLATILATTGGVTGKLGATGRQAINLAAPVEFAKDDVAYVCSTSNAAPTLSCISVTAANNAGIVGGSPGLMDLLAKVGGGYPIPSPITGQFVFQYAPAIALLEA